jgi:hypothetical protein
MAPEALLSGVVDDPRSDQYAVGVLLWELLTNHALFAAPTPMALVTRHAFEQPPRLAAVLPHAQPHPALEEILQRLLAKEPHLRFASAAAVVDAIDALPPEARAPLTGAARVPAPPSAPDPAAPTRSRIPAPGRPSAAPSGASSSHERPDLGVDAPTSVDMPLFIGPSPAAPASVTSSTPPNAVPLVLAPPPTATTARHSPTRSPRARVFAATVVVVLLLVTVALLVVVVAPASSSTTSAGSSSAGPVPVIGSPGVVPSGVVPSGVVPSGVVPSAVVPSAVFGAPVTPSSFSSFSSSSATEPTPRLAAPRPSTRPTPQPPPTPSAIPHVPDMSP